MTCLPAGATICLACIKRFDAEPLDEAIRWVSGRVSMVKITIGLTSALVGVSLCVLFLWFIRAGVIGGLAGGCLAAMVVAAGGRVSSMVVSILAPHLISRAQAKFELPDEVLEELRVVLR